MSLGTIKDYTPNFNLIIPEFNISGWHDYLEENFRSIDALFYNLFGINNYTGIWKKLTSYTAGQVVFIGDDTNYSGRLVKVLVNHTTTNDDFTTFFTNNPTYYELFTDASTAQYYAQQAKDWAVKMDGPIEGSNYSAKYYADIVDSLSTEITALYNIASEIQTVASISTDVENVADNETNINTVSTNISDISTVSSNITKISNVNDDLTNIDTVATDISDISLVAADITNVNTVAVNINTVTDVANNKTNIDYIANDRTNINAVANNLTNINAVNSNKTNIDTVASNQTNINTTATNMSNINTTASNITAIQNAPTYAANAATSASLAEDWATKTDGLVDNTDYSAKYYAQLAQTTVTNKANTDLSNLTSTGKSTAAELSRPSDTWIDLSIPANLTPVTAPANGYYCARSSGQLYLSIYNPLSSAADNEMMSTWLPMTGCALYLPVKKGQQVKLGYTTTPQYFRFVYAEGEI